MYSDCKSITILIALLKEYGIRHIVLSPGGSDIPIIHSLENDNYFKCYSVVDERSAIYFGIGISQVANEPVACVCTSGTAVCNFLPGITEAYYQNIPIIAITADKNPYFQGQIETQKIEQRNIFKGVVKSSVNLPFCYNETEIWYCERLVKEAFLSMSQHGKGPIHINIPIVNDNNQYSVKELPKINPIHLVSCSDDNIVWERYVNIISSYQKILLIIGQNILFSEEDKKNIESFFSKYNCCISVEHLSNLTCEGCINTYPITETGLLDTSYVPDLVISFGNNLAAYGMKPFLRKYHHKIRHIAVDEGGRLRDVYQCLSDIFECTPSYFFKYYGTEKTIKIKNNMNYYFLWKHQIDKFKYPSFEFSNFYVAQKLSQKIPENSILHLAILNSTRIMQFFKIPASIQVFSNVGALGIDGCLSTFIGQAACSNSTCFCVIGDLSFFYDMNAAGIRHIGNNVRIILLNNGGGAEFHLFVDKNVVPTLNKYICAEHHKTAKGWMTSLGFEYYSANCKEDFSTEIESFIKDSDKPKILEIFTDKEEDARLTKIFFSSNKPKRTISDIVKKVINRIKK